MKKYILPMICLCICAIFLLNALPVYAADHNTGGFNADGRSNAVSSMPVVVSLGDSYSAGEGIQPYYDQYEDDAYKYTSEDWIAHRSTLAWPGLLEFNGVPLNAVRATNLCVSDSRLHPALGVDNGSWYFAAVSGAVSENIYSKNNDDRQEKTVKQPFNDISFDAKVYDNRTYSLNFQIDAITSLPDPTAVDYVTLTLGGNDVGFVDIVTEAILGSKYVNMSVNGLKGKLLEELNTFWETGDKSTSLADKLENTYLKILEEASSATLVVAGYPQLIHINSDRSTDSWSISYEEAWLIDSAVSIFNSYLEEIISSRLIGYNAVFVDVQDAFKGHEAYSSEPFINGIVLGPQENVDTSGINFFVNSASFHPNKCGARAYADAVQKEINKHIEFDYYQQSLQKLEEADSFTMDMSIKTVSSITQDRINAKVTTNFNASCNIENYNTDSMEMTGWATLTGGGLDYAYDMTYKNSVAHYDYTKPNVDSVSVEMPFDLMRFEQIDEAEIEYVSSGTSPTGEIMLEFSVDGEAMTKRGAEILPQLIGSGYDVSYGDIEMTVLINQDSGELKSITMNFDTSMTAPGYEATASNEAVYEFTMQSRSQTAASTGFEVPEADEKRLSQVMLYDQDGVLSEGYEFSYNDEQLLTGILWRFFDSSGNVSNEIAKTLSYDADGHLLAVDQEDYILPVPIAEYQYNSQGQLTNSALRDGGEAECAYEYNAQGQLIRATAFSDFGDIVTDYIYDENGILVETKTSYDDPEMQTNIFTYEYDAEGRLAFERSDSGVKEYCYDYRPFVYLESRLDWGYTSGTLYLEVDDKMAYQIFGLQLYTPEFFTDSDGYLIQLTDTGRYSLCEFTYDGEMEASGKEPAETDYSAPTLSTTETRYQVFDINLTWQEAKAYCEEIGGHLAVITDADEQAFVESLLVKQGKNENYWIGGYYSPQSGAWAWIDGEVFSYTNWDEKQPDNMTGDEYYLRMVSKDIKYSDWNAYAGKWDDTANEADGNSGDAPLSTFGFVCEWE